MLTLFYRIGDGVRIDKSSKLLSDWGIVCLLMCRHFDVNIHCVPSFAPNLSIHILIRKLMDRFKPEGEIRQQTNSNV